MSRPHGVHSPQEQTKRSSTKSGTDSCGEGTGKKGQGEGSPSQEAHNEHEGEQQRRVERYVGVVKRLGTLGILR